MKAIELIRWAMHVSGASTEALVNDMREEALTPSTPGAKGGDGNHALWCLGHQAFAEAGIPKILFGEKNPLEHWAPLFAPGTTPKKDPGVYPPFDEVLRTYREVRANTLKLLERMTDDDLDRKSAAVPAGFEELMKSFGRTFMALALHNMMHNGQIADARRVAGRRPLR